MSAGPPSGWVASLHVAWHCTQAVAPQAASPPNMQHMWKTGHRLFMLQSRSPMQRADHVLTLCFA